MRAADGDCDHAGAFDGHRVDLLGRLGDDEESAPFALVTRTVAPQTHLGGVADLDLQRGAGVLAPSSGEQGAYPHPATPVGGNQTWSSVVNRDPM